MVDNRSVLSPFGLFGNVVSQIPPTVFKPSESYTWSIWCVDMHAITSIRPSQRVQSYAPFFEILIYPYIYPYFVVIGGVLFTISDSFSFGWTHFFYDAIQTQIVCPCIQGLWSCTVYMVFQRGEFVVKKCLSLLGYVKVNFFYKPSCSYHHNLNIQFSTLLAYFNFAWPCILPFFAFCIETFQMYFITLILTSFCFLEYISCPYFCYVHLCIC